MLGYHYANVSHGDYSSLSFFLNGDIHQFFVFPDVEWEKLAGAVKGKGYRCKMTEQSVDTKPMG